MSKPRYSWRESALTIAPPWRSASRRAIADLPAAVGPQMTRSARSPAPEASLELIPRKVDENRPSVHVVRGQGAAPEVAVECAHLVLRECVACLHGRLARNRRREQFLPGMHARNAIAR